MSFREVPAHGECACAGEEKLDALFPRGIAGEEPKRASNQRAALAGACFAAASPASRNEATADASP